jgi:hypothetical protein
MCVFLCICLTMACRQNQTSTAYTPNGVVFRPASQPPPAATATTYVYGVPATTNNANNVPVATAVAVPVTDSNLPTTNTTSMNNPAAAPPQVEVEYDPVTKQYRNKDTLAQV